MRKTTFLNYFDISSIRRISFREDINGLRAIAVLSVVFYHANFPIFKGGWLGVDIFFVISGYLISNIIVSELNESKFSFRRFYIRRIKRILPALFFTIIMTIPFAFWLLTPKAMNEYLNSLLASLFFYANYYFMNLEFYISEVKYLNNEWGENKNKIKLDNMYKSIENENVFFVDTYTIFCTEIEKNYCVGSDSNNIYIYDDNHPSDVGGKLIINKIKYIIDFLNSNP